MKRKKSNNYFEMLLSLAEHSCEAAEDLSRILNNFDPSKLMEEMEHLHCIEHEADKEKHEMMKKLLHEFITPIEREDIFHIASVLDDVTDSIEDILIKIFMFNIKEIKPDAIEFMAIVFECSKAIKVVMKEFHNFKKSNTIADCIVEINRLEELGDDLYMKAVRNLHISNATPSELIAWTEVFSRFEKCCDSCEDVANAVESVMIKNS